MKNHKNTMALLLALPTVLTALAVSASVLLSNRYYSLAPFHFDSAAYRLSSLHAYKIYEQKGRLGAAIDFLYTKDCLDVFIRLLLFPKSLTYLHGHMAVLSMFMFLYFLLLTYYGVVRRQSIVKIMVACLVVFMFPLIYNPYTGIADYWKDNIAIWLIGCSVISFCLSDKFNNVYWSLFFSFLLGLLIIQRSALSVYLSIVYLPVYVYCFYCQIKHGNTREALRRMAASVVPAIILFSLVAILQWDSLYHYYFRVGYEHSTVIGTAKYLRHVIKADFGATQISLLGIMALFVAVFIKKININIDIVVSFYLSLAFPVLIVAMSMRHNLFKNTIYILFITLISAVVLNFKKTSQSRAYVERILITMIVSIMPMQLFSSVVKAEMLSQKNKDFKFVYQDISDLLRKAKSKNLSLIYNEADLIFLNHIWYNEKTSFTSPYYSGPEGIYSDKLNIVGITYVHDSYYRANFPGKSVKDLVEINLRQIEEHRGTIAIAYSDTESLKNSSDFGPDGKNIALPIAVALHEYLQESHQWRPLKTIRSPHGDLMAYQFIGN